jgi:mono/diheme cytochrome c family protein
MTMQTISLQRLAVLLVILPVLVVMGCQGTPKEKPPIHVNPNMDNTPRYDPQEASEFFADGRAMRHAPKGTIARGDLREDRAWYEGVGPDGQPIGENPLPLTASALERGRERFDIFCAACHSRVGDGKGIVTQRGFVPPPTFHSDLMRNYADGHIFEVISNGIRNMPAYAPQIPVEDRWRIVHYVRALQRSQHATISDVPEELRDRLR